MRQRLVAKEQWLQADNDRARICPRLLDKVDEIYQKKQEIALGKKLET